MDWGFGTGQGERTDLEKVSDYVKEGKSMTEIGEEYPIQVIKFHKGILYLSSLLKRPRIGVKEVEIYWGDTGTGKTRKALDIDEKLYQVNVPGKDGQVWYDGYDGQKTILFDDFYGWISWVELLRITDRYAYRLRVKGGYLPCMANRIIFTSNTHPDNWYNYSDRMVKAAFQRRVNYVFEFKDMRCFGTRIVIKEWKE